MRKATWHMNRVELARTYAEVRGYVGRPGGWIYSPTGRPVAHGWGAFARRLVQTGRITVGVGINWIADHRPTTAQL